MKRIKRLLLALAFLVSISVPTLKLATTSAGVDLQPAQAFACEAPNPNGGCGGG